MAMILQAQLATHAADGIAGRTTAFNNASWWTLALTAVAVIPALALPRHRKEPTTLSEQQAERPTTQRREMTRCTVQMR